MGNTDSKLNDQGEGKLRPHGITQLPSQSCVTSAAEAIHHN
jgi:hypothetical protein